MRTTNWLVLAGGLSTVLCAGGASSRPARCETSDGSYACDFSPIGRDGSFQIKAPGKPSYSIIVDSPGTGHGFLNMGERNVSLPGTYRVDPRNPGCWVGDANGTRICAK